MFLKMCYICAQNKKYKGLEECIFFAIHERILIPHSQTDAEFE